MTKPTVLALLLLPLIAGTLHAQTVTAHGQGTITFDGRLDPEERQAAMLKAKLSALETHLASSPELLRAFNQKRTELTADIDKYALAATVLDETEDKKSRIFSVILQVEFSETRLRADLASTSATGRTAGEERTPILMVFMAREQASVQAFDDKVYKRADVRAESSVDGSSKERAQEGESIRASSVTTTGSIDRSQTSTAQASVATTTGGSTTRRSEAVTWRVSTAGEFDNAMSKHLAAAGFELAPADYIIGQSLERIRNDFSTDSDLSPPVLQAAVKAVKEQGISILTLGTMDVGVRSIDSATGLVRVTVTISGKVMDVSGRFPRILAGLSPIQYAGLGADETAARNSALVQASDKAAKEIVDALNARQFR